MKNQEELMKHVLSLSCSALAEEKRDRFIQCLQERAPLLKELLADPPEVEEDVAKMWLETETALSARMEKERGLVLQEMEGLSSRRKAVGRYAPKFPFPPLPVFFDRDW